MLVYYYTHKPEEGKVKRIQVGNKLVGTRLLAVTLESNEELNELLSEKGIAWAKRNINFSKTTTVVPVESNWGSDWVDDGV